MKVLACILLLLGASGCAVRSLQLEEVWVRVAARDAVPRDARPFRWQLEFNGGRYTVFPVATGEGFVFRDATGIEVGFDGLDVTHVRGLPGAIGDFRLVRVGTTRVIERPGLERQVLQCAPTEERGRGWRTRCTASFGGRSYPMNAESFNGSDGSLEAVSVALVPGASPLSLRRVATLPGSGG